MVIGNNFLFIQKERMSILAKIMAPSCRDRDNKRLIAKADVFLLRQTRMKEN